MFYSAFVHFCVHVCVSTNYKDVSEIIIFILRLCKPAFEVYDVYKDNCEVFIETFMMFTETSVYTIYTDLCVFVT